MRQSPALVVTLSALMLWVLFSLFWYPEKIQAALRVDSTEVLTRAGFSSVRPSVEGRDVVLEGRVGSEEDRLKAEDLIRGVRGVLGVENRLLWSVDTAPEPPPSFLELLSRPEGILLRGPVPTEAFRRSLLARAIEWVGEDSVEERLVVDSGVVADKSLNSAADILAVLVRSDPGILVRFRRGSIRLSGTLPSESARRRVDQAIREAAPDVGSIFSVLQVSSARAANLP